MDNYKMNKHEIFEMVNLATRRERFECPETRIVFDYLHHEIA